MTLKTLHTLAPVIISLIHFFYSIDLYSPGLICFSYTQTAVRMRNFTAITVHPEIQDGAPVFSGTRVRIETFYDFLRVGVSVSEFLDEFPSITRDQVLEVYDLVKQKYTVDQISALVAGPQSRIETGTGRLQATA